MFRYANWLYRVRYYSIVSIAAIATVPSNNEGGLEMVVFRRAAVGVLGLSAVQLAAAAGAAVGEACPKKSVRVGLQDA
jgi:hypothetical protein